MYKCEEKNFAPPPSSFPLPTNKTELAGKYGATKRVRRGASPWIPTKAKPFLSLCIGDISATMSARLTTLSSELHLNSTRDDGESRGVINGELRGFILTCFFNVENHRPNFESFRGN